MEERQPSKLDAAGSSPAGSVFLLFFFLFRLEGARPLSVLCSSLLFSSLHPHIQRGCSCFYCACLFLGANEFWNDFWFIFNLQQKQITIITTKEYEQEHKLLREEPKRDVEKHPPQRLLVLAEPVQERDGEHKEDLQRHEVHQEGWGRRPRPHHRREDKQQNLHRPDVQPTQQLPQHTAHVPGFSRQACHREERLQTNDKEEIIGECVRADMCEWMFYKQIQLKRGSI